MNKSSSVLSWKIKSMPTLLVAVAKLIKKCEASFSGALIRKKAKAYLAILEERELALYLLILTSAVLSLVLLNALE